MGFPGSENWASVAGSVIYPGAGGSGPGMWTVIAIAACIVVLVVGQGIETRKYRKAGK